MVVVVGHLEKLLVSDKSHVKHGKTYLFAKSLFSGLVGLGEKFEFFEGPCSNGASTSTSASASTGNVGSTGGSKHQLPKLAEYDDWAFTPIGYFRSLAIALVLAIALALAIAPHKYWR